MNMELSIRAERNFAKLNENSPEKDVDRFVRVHRINFHYTVVEKKVDEIQDLQRAISGLRSAKAEIGECSVDDLCELFTAEEESTDKIDQAIEELCAQIEELLSDPEVLAAYKFRTAKHLGC
jgi:hypothetical protein